MFTCNDGGRTVAMSVTAATNKIKNLACPDSVVKGKGKVFYGQEPPSGEPTTTDCGVNYKLLAVY